MVVNLSAQGSTCDFYNYYTSTQGFLCGDRNGEICVTTSADYIDIDCLEGFHLEITIFGRGATVTGVVGNPYYLIDNGSLTTPIVLGANLDPLFDVERTDCFELSLLRPDQSELVFEIVNNDDPTDRRFVQQLNVGQPQIIGSPGATTLLSSLIGTDLPAGGTTGRFQLEGTLLVDVNYSFGSFAGAGFTQLTMGVGASIDVQTGRSLDFTRCRLEPCEGQWRGVTARLASQVSCDFTTLLGAEVAFNLEDRSILRAARTSISNCGIGINATQPTPEGPTILFAFGRSGVMSIAHCETGIRLHNAGDQTLVGNLSISNIAEHGIEVRGQGTSLTAGGADSPGQFGARFLIEQCGGAGISLDNRVGALSFYSGGIYNCNWGIQSSATDIIEVNSSLLIGNTTGISSSQWNFFFPSSPSAFIPTYLDITSSEFAGNQNDMIGFEYVSSAIISDNNFFEAGSGNIALLGLPAGEHAWFISENQELDANSFNVLTYGAIGARVDDNPGIYASTNNIQINGGEDIRVARNVGDDAEGNYVVNASHQRI